MTLCIELDTVGQWLHVNRLTLNTVKTKFIIFGRRYKLAHTDQFNLGISGELIEQVYSFKYLGVFLDHFLSFNEHIDYLLFKADQKLGVLCNVSLANDLYFITL